MLEIIKAEETREGSAGEVLSITVGHANASFCVRMLQQDERNLN